MVLIIMLSCNQFKVTHLLKTTQEEQSRCVDLHGGNVKGKRVLAKIVM